MAETTGVPGSAPWWESQVKALQNEVAETEKDIANRRKEKSSKGLALKAWLNLGGARKQEEDTDKALTDHNNKLRKLREEILPEAEAGLKDARLRELRLVDRMRAEEVLERLPKLRAAIEKWMNGTRMMVEAAAEMVTLKDEVRELIYPINQGTAEKIDKMLGGAITPYEKDVIAAGLAPYLGIRGVPAWNDKRLDGLLHDDLASVETLSRSTIEEREMAADLDAKWGEYQRQGQ